MIFVTASAAVPASSPAGAAGRTGNSEVIDCFRPRLCKNAEENEIVGSFGCPKRVL